MKALDADTAIMIVTADSPLCAGMLKAMRMPGALSASASSTFETAWRVYKKRYAPDGGVFGVLIHGRIRDVGPVVVFGMPTEVGNLARFLSLKAREITRTTLTPIVTEKALHAAVMPVIAELTNVEGSA